MEVKIFLSNKTKRGKMTVEEAGRLGGERTSATHGEEFYSEIGHKGGQKVRRLIEAGKEYENR
jgi:general stress protein YciG